ncbi:hypothetical protein [Methanosarcina horonobensis]|nr:hypothetical protein [Methanosarcina horonobensis]
MAEYKEEEDELLSKISEKCQASSEEKCDCYCGENPHYIEFNEVPGYLDQIYRRTEQSSISSRMWKHIKTELVSA